jgi:hypothetical protein
MSWGYITGCAASTLEPRRQESAKGRKGIDGASLEGEWVQQVTSPSFLGNAATPRGLIRVSHPATIQIGLLTGAID